MRRLRPTLLLATVLVAAASLAAQQPRRIVAIADIHGAIDEFVGIMRAAKLIDGSRQWAGGNATFVQTGDYTDRGAGVRPVLDLLMALEPQAARAGGRAITLLGNHEVMNLIGEQRDVTPEIYATFADAESEARRERAWTQYAELGAARAKARPVVPDVYAVTREHWMAEHPPGWLEYREAFLPKGRYGRWLRDKTISTTLDGTLFMHAGPDPAGTDAVDAIETRVRQEIATFDRFVDRAVSAKLALPFFDLNELMQVAAAEIRVVNAIVAASKETGGAPDLRGVDVEFIKLAAEVIKIAEWNLLKADGPLWYRGYAATPEGTLRAPVASFFSRNNLSRIVVGHTPSADRRIVARLGASVVLLDTGMLTSAYKGRPSALEISGNQLTAIYLDGRVPLDVAKPSPALVLERQRQ